jgi:hypothetical protein
MQTTTKDYVTLFAEAHEALDRARGQLYWRWQDRPAERTRLLAMTEEKRNEVKQLAYTPNPTTAATATALVAEFLPQLERTERELREKVEAQRVAEGQAKAEAARRRFAAEHTPAQLIDMVETHGRHVHVVLTEDGQLGVRGLRDLDPHVRYAMTVHVDTIKALLRERQQVVLIA